MQLTLASTLAQTFSEVLGNLAFMFATDASSPGDAETSCAVDPATADAPDSSASVPAVWFDVGIGYTGTASGHLRLICPRSLALLLSANLLGIDAEEQPEKLNAEDAVKELMNVVCGQLVTTLHGSQAVFHLTIPEVHELTAEAAAQPCDGAEVIHLCVEGYGIQLAYTAD